MRYGVAILIIAFFAIVGTVVLASSNRKQSRVVNSARITKMADYDSNDNASITYTTQGKLVGEDQFKAVRVTVTRSKRTVEVLNNYEERVEKSAEFTNSPAAFETFVRALDHANFGKERTVKTPDDRGMCPTGRKFIYRMTDNGQEVMRTWSDACSAAEGPFGGSAANAQTIQRLFQAQITDYNKFVSGVAL